MDTVAKTFANAALMAMFSLSIFSAGPLPAFADGQTEKFKLPPVDLKDKDRCKLTSSSIGQANAARDKLYDLRMCDLSGQSAVGYDLSGVIMTGTDVSKVNFQDAFFSKAYLHGTEERISIMKTRAICRCVCSSNYLLMFAKTFCSRMHFQL